VGRGGGGGCRHGRPSFVGRGGEPGGSVGGPAAVHGKGGAGDV
jgi:hypothetical protein